MQSLEHDGDAIERAYLPLINSHFPSYGRIWAEYIGNDGSSRLPMRDAFSDEENERREFTSQCIYTALVAVICADRLRQARSSGASIGEYLDTIHSRVAFYAHLGRLRDCIKRVGELWKVSDLAAPLEDLYQRRNSALHDSLPSCVELYETLAFVRPGGDEDPKGWGRRSRWSESNHLDFQPLDEHIQETMEEVLALLESIFARLYSAVTTTAPTTVKSVRQLAPLNASALIPSSSSATSAVIFGNWSDILRS